MRFAPQEEGASAATLTLTTNALVQPPVVTLAGTGRCGAGERSDRAAGAAGPPGKVEARDLPQGEEDGHRASTARSAHDRTSVHDQDDHGKASFTSTSAKASERATLSRGGLVYADAAAQAPRARWCCARDGRSPPGAITLTLRRLAAWGRVTHDARPRQRSAAERARCGPVCENMAMPTVEEIREALRVVIDPELHRSIVELDMVRRIDLGPDGEVAVTVSLTTAGCPIRGHFQGAVRDARDGPRRRALGERRLRRARRAAEGGAARRRSAATSCPRARSRRCRTSSASAPARAASASRR